MLLNAEQILAVRTSRTVEVEVPEWGAGAKVLVGAMGGLARMRFLDWIETLGRLPEGPEPEDSEPISCDSPPEALVPPTEARCRQLAGALAALMGAVKNRVKQSRLDKILARAEETLNTAEPEKVYTLEDNYRMTLRWCAECILDPDSHRPAFTMQDIEKLGALDMAPLERVATAARELSAATVEARESLEKNSGPTTDGASGSV